MIFDLFAGPGGWDEGLRLLGRTDVIGVEWDQAAVETARAAGHKRLHGDVALTPIPTRWPAEGLIASPPCQGWSRAGKGRSRQDQEAVVALCDRMAQGLDSHDFTTWEDERSSLAAEPVRWVRELRPRWVAFEQVEAVLPLWQHIAGILRGWGYHAWTGKLVAADYGVPQTRTRAFLLASLDREVGPPMPTHAKEPGEALFSRLSTWVSMAEALGWQGEVGFPRRADSSDATPDGFRARDLTATSEPAPTVTSKGRSWMLRAGNQDRATERDLDEPAPTVAFGNGAADHQWVMRGSPTVLFGDRLNKVEWSVRDLPGPAPGVERVNDQTGALFDEQWPLGRPATTIASRALVPHPGENNNRHNGATKSRNDGVRVSIEEAATLQSFPWDYPWRGSRTAIFRQIGDAVPPLMAAHVLSALGVGEVPGRLRERGWRAENRA